MQQLTSYQYTIRRGETLNGIIHKLYGIHPADKRFPAAKAFLLSLNPQISNPNRIFSGHIIRVDEFPPRQVITQSVKPQPVSSPSALLMAEKSTAGMCRGAPLPQWQSGPQLRPSSGPIRAIETKPQDQEALWALSWLEHNANLLTIPGAVLMGSLGHLNNAGNTQLITGIIDSYADLHNDKLTRGQYDYRRAKNIKLLQQRIGPMESLLFGRNTAPQALRIARGGAIPATSHLTRHADKMKRIASLSRSGGILLTGVGVMAACMQIAQTQDKKKKNEIFVATLASTVR